MEGGGTKRKSKQRRQQEAARALIQQQTATTSNSSNDSKQQQQDWKHKWNCNKKSREQCLKEHQTHGCKEAESRKECESRLAHEEAATNAVLDNEKYDEVVERFTDVSLVRANLVKIANFLREYIDSGLSPRQQEKSNNFCTFGDNVGRDVNTQFEIVKMLVRALALQQNRQLDDWLREPLQASITWTKIMKQTTESQNERQAATPRSHDALAHLFAPEVAAVNYMLLQCNVFLPLEDLEKTRVSLPASFRKSVSSHMRRAYENSLTSEIQADPVYSAAAQLASDAWVQCNQSTSNLQFILSKIEGIISLINAPSSVLDAPAEEEMVRDPVVPLRSSSIADQRMMHQIFGTMRANRLRHKHSSRQRRRQRHSSRQSGGRRSRSRRRIPRNTQSGGGGEGGGRSRRSRNTTRPPSLSRTAQRPRSRYSSRTKQRPRPRSRSRPRFVQRRSVFDTRRSRQ